MAQLKKILLVDDDDDLRDALSEQLLLTEDFDVFEAGNGADAKTRAAEACMIWSFWMLGCRTSTGVTCVATCVPRA